MHLARKVGGNILLVPTSGSSYVFIPPRDRPDSYDHFYLVILPNNLGMEK